MKRPAIYITANKKNGTLYTGVTSDLPKRIAEHKSKTTKGFSSQYDCTHLVYFEMFEDMENALIREKLIKGGSRQKKLALIESSNPDWRDLFEEICR